MSINSIQLLKETSTEDHLRTEIYQGPCYNKEFAFPLNVVIILKTNLNTGAQAHVILFSTDLELTYDKIIKFYSLRFRLTRTAFFSKVAVTSQIEFNFRDAKQYCRFGDRAQRRRNPAFCRDLPPVSGRCEGRRKMARDKPDEENLFTLAEAYCMTGQYDSCLKTAQKVIQLNPNSAVGYNAIGAAYVALGRLDEGIVAVKKALELDPNLKTAQANFASFTSHAQLSAP